MTINCSAEGRETCRSNAAMFGSPSLYSLMFSPADYNVLAVTGSISVDLFDIRKLKKYSTMVNLIDLLSLFNLFNLFLFL